MDLEAVVNALESGHLAAAGIDTIEGEVNYFSGRGLVFGRPRLPAPAGCRQTAITGSRHTEKTSKAKNAMLNAFNLCV